MSIAICKECQVVVEGQTLTNAETDEECCPYCKQPITELPEDDPKEDR